MWRTYTSVLRFLWSATAGNRLRPWRSSYLRWRVETYTGKPAASLRLRDFLHFAVSERRQLGRFSRWMGEMARLSEGREPE
jgi:hypothetical protein